METCTSGSEEATCRPTAVMRQGGGSPSYDRLKYGTEYFHTFHQMDGIDSCYRHAVRLLPYKGSLANLFVGKSGKPPEIECLQGKTEETSREEFEIAKKAVQMFGLNVNTLIPLYQKRFLELDLLDSHNMKDLAKLVSLIRSRLSPFLFKKFVPENRKNWIRGIPLYPGKTRPLYSFYHVLLCYVLGIEVESPEVQMPEPLSCPRCSSFNVEETGRRVTLWTNFNCRECSHIFRENDFPVIDELKDYINMESGNPSHPKREDSEVLELVKPVIKNLESRGDLISESKVSKILGFQIVSRKYPKSSEYIKRYTLSEWDRIEMEFLQALRETETDEPIAEQIRKKYPKYKFGRSRNKLLRLHKTFIEEIENERQREKQNTAVLPESAQENGEGNSP